MSFPLFSAVLALPSTATSVNFYLDSSDGHPAFHSTAAQRRDRLEVHLSAVDAGDILMVGEAAGWRGARQSGVAFTSPVAVGLRGTREPSATTVHRALTAHRLEQRTLLWNAFPLHPHKLGDPETNRTPTSAELTMGERVLREAVVGRRVICVGGKAAVSVERVLGTSVPTVWTMNAHSRAVSVRHPSFGGTTEFREGVDEAVDRWKL